jgi:hypothetical protein
MTMNRAVIMTLVALSVLAGCARAKPVEMTTGPTPAAQVPVPAANVAGHWTGSAGTGGTFVPVTLTLAQTGNTVNGTINVAGRPDYSGPVTGIVQGETIKLSLRTTTLAQLMVRQDTITGEAFPGVPLNLRRSG